jgi:triosephosphate isomerase
MIVVNFKTYPLDALALARACEEVAHRSRKKIVVCPQTTDMWIAREVRVSVFAQHVDAVECGQSTGAITAESVKKAGGAGTLLNHSEKRMRIADIDFSIQKCRPLGLTTIVCTNNASVSTALASLNPDYIAIEPPELIGGNVSVTTANPGIVSDTVARIRKIDASMKILCGAGIKNGRDVAKACELGCVGILVASGVTKAKNPRAVLEDLVSGF